MNRTEYIEKISNLALSNGRMAFISGPRQVGKTTLARQIAETAERSIYYSWDDVAFKRDWIKDPKLLIPDTPGIKPVVIFDELHKAPRWKSSLKGLYDTRGNLAEIIVTGSARLDIFRRGGDSLLGRYLPFKLHPLSIGEIHGSSSEPDKIKADLGGKITPHAETFNRLNDFGGFPDPYFKADKTWLNLWHKNRTERLIREDLLDLTRTHELSLIETLSALLSERAGSLLSIQSIAGDLRVSHQTIGRWLDHLASLYYAYYLTPYNRLLARSLLKQPKLYLWDWSEINDPGARYENLVAGHLLKAVGFWNDTGAGKFALHYLRDKEKREVDFIVLKNGEPWLMAEAKLADLKPAGSLSAFAHAMKPEMAIQVVAASGVHERFEIKKDLTVTVISADRFLGLLP